MDTEIVKKTVVELSLEEAWALRDILITVAPISTESPGWNTKTALYSALKKIGV